MDKIKGVVFCVYLGTTLGIAAVSINYKVHTY